MYLNELMKERHMTRAELCEKSGIPESTLRDILNGRTQIDHCKAGTLYYLAEVLDTTVEEILSAYWDECLDENEPESIVLHDDTAMIKFYEIVFIIRRILRHTSGMQFVRFICENNFIEMCYVGRLYKVALFFLGVIDHFCKENNCPPEPRFDEYRSGVLDETVVSRHIANLVFTPIEFLKATEDLNRHAIPELARFNILMTEEDISPLCE